MDDTAKSTQQLVAELGQLRARLEDFERLEIRERQIEKSLLETEARYRLMAENVRDVIWTMDLNMRFTFVSPSTVHLRGYSVEEAVNQSIEEVMTPQSVVIAKQALAEELALERTGNVDRNRSRTIELELLHKNGSIVHAEVKVSFLYDMEGKLFQILGITRDISERKRVEEKLDQWAQIFKYAHWGVAVCSAETSCYEMVNSSYAAMHGWTVEQLIGKSLRTVYAEFDEDSSREINKVLHGKGHHHYESLHLRKDGSVFPAIVYVTAIKDHRGQVKWYAANTMDITEQKRGERAFRTASRMEATTTLAGGIAHDFNNLMVSVLGNASLIKMHLTEHHPCTNMLHDIERAAEKAGLLSQQMLAFARGGKYQPKVLNLNHTIRETVEIHANSIPSKIQLTLDFDPELWNTMADPTQMGQIVVNLCINAVEAIDSHGEIRIVTRNVEAGPNETKRRRSLKAGRYVVFSVEDSGHGMNEETRGRAFEPFFTTKDQGRGLGLAAVYGIVKNHGGYIYVDTAPCEGCCFTIYLPTTEAPSKQAPEQPVSGPNGTETILVVDDESMVVSVTRQILERFGYSVISASNGKEAIEAASGHDGEIAAALLDMAMPVMGGAEAYPLLQRARPAMKVIICSGYELSAASQDLLDAGAASFLQKPFTPRKLCEEIRRALDAR